MMKVKKTRSSTQVRIPGQLWSCSASILPCLPRPALPSYSTRVRIFRPAVESLIYTELESQASCGVAQLLFCLVFPGQLRSLSASILPCLLYLHHLHELESQASWSRFTFIIYMSQSSQASCGVAQLLFCLVFFTFIIYTSQNPRPAVELLSLYSALSSLPSSSTRVRIPGQLWSYSACILPCLLYLHHLHELESQASCGVAQLLFCLLFFTFIIYTSQNPRPAVESLSFYSALSSQASCGVARLLFCLVFFTFIIYMSQNPRPAVESLSFYSALSSSPSSSTRVRIPGQLWSHSASILPCLLHLHHLHELESQASCGVAQLLFCLVFFTFIIYTSQNPRPAVESLSFYSALSSLPSSSTRVRIPVQLWSRSASILPCLLHLHHLHELESQASCGVAQLLFCLVFFTFIIYTSQNPRPAVESLSFYSALSSQASCEVAQLLFCLVFFTFIIYTSQNPRPAVESLSFYSALSSLPSSST